MRATGRGLCSLVAMLAAAIVSAGVARAQDARTVELSVFSTQGRFDGGMPWSTPSQAGLGGRLGFFVIDHLALEFTGGRTSGNGKELSYAASGVLAWHGALSERFDVHAGGGLLVYRQQYGGVNGSYAYLKVPVNSAQSSVWDVGTKVVLGVDWRFTNRVGIRVDGTLGTVYFPDDRLGLTARGMEANVGIEAGLTVRAGGGRDTDGDGVDDKKDTCDATPRKIRVDANGCPLDADKDGVADYLDKCPATPAAAKVDAAGCPLDTDADGVADYLDTCAATPAGVKVDVAGCPLDADQDGVADYLDKCPETPAGVKVDAAGCPLDTDRDGVADFLDKCPDTTPGTKVDATGCSIDADSDGVADADDRCPATPVGIKVDATGCPVDTDGDGVADDKDKCPATAKGTPVDAVGCTLLFTPTRKSITLQGVTFEPTMATLLPESYAVLNKVAEILAANPGVRVSVEGYTDNKGPAMANRKLSQQRAESVRNYLISKGVAAENVTARGFGPAKPVADNGSEAGRAQNRRVELRQVP